MGVANQRMFFLLLFLLSTMWERFRVDVRAIYCLALVTQRLFGSNLGGSRLSTSAPVELVDEGRPPGQSSSGVSVFLAL